MKTALAAAALAFLATTARAQAPEFRLGDAATPTAYALRLAIDPREPTFEGEVRITMRLKSPARVVWMNATALDIQEASFTQGGERIAAEAAASGEDFVQFTLPRELAAGEAVAHIRWKGPVEGVATRGLFRQQDAGQWYAMTQLEAISARRVLPSFDEPGWKTPWQLTIDAPSSDKALSNTPEERALPIEGRPGWTRHVFARTAPLPTYLVALGVGPFDVVDGGTAGAKPTPLRYVVAQGRGAEASWAVESTPRVLALLEDYFGQPYPFEKLDSATIPSTVGFGAMENVGFITYSAELMLAPPQRQSLAFKRAYASVAAHEIAHQWFGDLVTLAFWNDIWLNEAFATWAARKTMRAYKPEWQRGWRSGEQRRQALRADRIMSARRIANPVQTRNDISGAFDAVTYQKGSEVLSMFEAWLGPERFRAGVRTFLRKHAFGNATSDDFFRDLGEASGRGEAAIAAFRSFVDQPGVPLVDVALRCEGARATVRLDQHRLVPRGTEGPDGRWTTPACFRFPAGGQLAKQCTEITGAKDLVLDTKSCPAWVAANADGAGHWLARYDAATFARLLRALPTMPELEAVAAVGDARLLMTSGLLSVADGLRVARAAFASRALGVQHGAVDLLEHVQPRSLVGPLRAEFDALQVRYVRPLAHRIGWTPRPGEDLDTQELRALLLPFAAAQGDAKLAAEARRIAGRWLDDPAKVDPSAAAAVLRAAGSGADAAFYDRMEARLAKATLRRERNDLLQGLAAVHDPGLVPRVQALALRDDAIDGRELLYFLENALGERASADATLAFVMAQWESISRKLPPDSSARLMRYVATRTCTPESRDRFESFFAGRAPQLQGGPRAYAQALEAIKVCVAASEP